jgi:hypothetical protein
MILSSSSKHTSKVLAMVKSIAVSPLLVAFHGVGVNLSDSGARGRREEALDLPDDAPRGVNPGVE